MNLKPCIFFVALILTGLWACNGNSPRISEEITSETPIAQSNEDGFILEVLYQKLDKKVDETSGLELIDGNLWTHNDSGGEAKIYNIDLQSGQVISTESIVNASNKDWEDITSDDTHIYIGDFGNNTGGRNDLAIYKVPISNLTQDEDIDTELITFTYPDQTEFYSGYNHNFDCEAMVSKGDSLYLFSKNWLDRRCKLYALSKKENNQKATLISEFDSEGTITGASLDNTNQILYLIGYIPGEGFQSFLWVIYNWDGNNFLSGEKTKYNLKLSRQTEAIQTIDKNTVLISAESDSSEYPALYKITISE